MSSPFNLMQFVFADSQDFVDPDFDFVNDAYRLDRLVQRDDQYPHEYFEKPPYDGMLVSRAIVGDERFRGKYTTAQSIRFRRDGARAFLRYQPGNDGGILMGDCGAFSYLRLEEPPFSVEDMVDYYGDCQFTHAVSIDHVILGYDASLDKSPELVPAEFNRRFELTLKLGEKFLNRTQTVGAAYVPIGVTQGWSPKSYAEGASRLQSIGYKYVALGGLAMRRVGEIKEVLKSVREVVSPKIPLHIFGFTKADEIEQFVDFGIGSFDSTSPMLRSFRDGKRNYYLQDEWYTALRVPHADESPKFRKAILAGAKVQQDLRSKERQTLDAIRSFAMTHENVEQALRMLQGYGEEFGANVDQTAYRRTLEDRPWEKCSCKVCKEIGVEVVLFRGSNRNRRRGFHNLWNFYQKLDRVRCAGASAI